MKRTPLLRKIPLKRRPITPKQYDPFWLVRQMPGVTMSSDLRKPRTRLKPQSDRMREEQKKYRKAKREWIAERKAIDGFGCEYSDTRGNRCTARADVHPHHKRKRGKYLSDKTFFMAVCLYHHRQIEENLKAAEKQGYIIREYEKH